MDRLLVDFCQEYCSSNITFSLTFTPFLSGIGRFLYFGGQRQEVWKEENNKNRIAKNRAEPRQSRHTIVCWSTECGSRAIYLYGHHKTTRILTTIVILGSKLSKIGSEFLLHFCVDFGSFRHVIFQSKSKRFLMNLNFNLCKYRI